MQPLDSKEGINMETSLSLLTEDPVELQILNIKVTLMSKIREKVKDSGKTQKEMGKILGISQSRLSNLMTGSLSLFSVDGLMEIALKAGIKLTLQVEEDLCLPSNI